MRRDALYAASTGKITSPFTATAHLRNEARSVTLMLRRGGSVASIDCTREGRAVRTRRFPNIH